MIPLEDELETSDIPSKQECEGPVHRDQQLVSPTQRGRSVETTPYDPSKEPSSQLTIPFSMMRSLPGKPGSGTTAL